MPNYLRKNTNFKIEAKKILNLVYLQDYAECTHQELVRALSIRIRNLCAC
jgi:hypothetical protein